MGGWTEDNELLNRWKWKGPSLRRRWPLRLVDREGLQALVEAVQGPSGPLPTINLNGIDTRPRPRWTK